MSEGSRTDRELWNERYREREHHHGGDPAEILTANVEWLPAGRALDVATGTGRNARFLAGQGYEVDAVDVADEGLAIARRKAREAGVDVNWIQADLNEFPLPEETYAVVCVVGYKDLDLLEDLKAALAPGGVLVYEHHLGPAAIADSGPRTDRFRFRSNALLRACLDLTVLEYREWTKVSEGEDGTPNRDPRVSLLARNGLDGEPWYPPAESYASH
ncbi:MAG: class I SAM-dependent methyltransferase [Haloferacaceae archaeon]